MERRSGVKGEFLWLKKREGLADRKSNGEKRLSGVRWFKMIRVVLDTPKHHGTESKQHKHLYTVWKLICKSYKNTLAGLGKHLRNTTPFSYQCHYFYNPRM